MDIQDLKQRVEKTIDQWFDELPTGTVAAPAAPTVPEGTPEEAPARVLPKGKKVVRTKSQGDRVYYIDEEAKTCAWAVSPEVVEGLGFEMNDVVEVDDTELLKYARISPIHKVPEKAEADA